LNYVWDKEKLQQSARFACRNTDRKRDVFVGNDVFGRGTFGGGGYNIPAALSA
jgi:hypothetical protein